MKKIVVLLIIFMSLFTISFAHSGRTDSNGGHYDRSTGEYHYHHGYPAHQHNADGSCPYETNSVVENTTEDSDTGELKINNNSDGIIKILQSQVEEKDNKISELESKIKEKDNKISEIESDKENLHFCYIFAIVMIIAVAFRFYIKKLDEVEKLKTK